MMYLLIYKVESDSGNGPYTYQHKKICKSEEELTDRIQQIREESAEARHGWEHKDPKWRGKWEPRYWDIHIYRTREVPLEPYIEAAQDSYNAAYEAREVIRVAEVAKWAEHRRKEYEKLHSEFGGET